MYIPLYTDPDEAYLEAVLVSVQGDNVVVDTKGGKRFTVDASIPHDRYSKPTHRFGKKLEETSRRLLPRSIQRNTHGVENMDDLHPLNEASILSNIEHRFRLDYIYTRTGPILIAMNPFKWLPIYGEEIVRQYHNRPYGSLPPHCFQEAEDAYQQLQFTKHNQSVVICGESGAGKTETTKLMLQYLSIVARDKTKSGQGGVKTIGEKLVQSNPLMEAFGNAKTPRNNNSSRFGKFTLLNFSKGFQISGGKVSNFLLEKSRVVRQQKNERNYHIFYQLVAGASDELRARLHLPEPSEVEKFFYLSQSGCLKVEGVDDAEDFATTRNAMEAVSIRAAEQDDLFQLVAGVLHLGDVDFIASEDGESSTVDQTTLEALQLASKLLGLKSDHVAEAITTRVRQLPGGKTVRSPQTDAQSRDSRDALAKAVYNKIFDHLVLKINTAFDRDSSPNPAFIGILDIFGFEDMASNGFEQLLINFTNEKLQLLFNEATFKMEEEEYMREQIQWDRTEFPDNQPCVDLIEKKPMGLLPVLDSECTRGAAASDVSLVATLHKSFKSHAHYSVCGPSTAWRKANDNHSFTNETDFVVIHFAGPVIYTCEEFVDKNRDALFDHVNTMTGTSSNAMISELFMNKEDGGNALRAASITVSQRFTNQLNNLTQTLQSCNVRFVRCIKSNMLLHPQVIEKPSVLKQLICSGVMAALEVRRAGFPTRTHYTEFVKDFRVFSVGFPKDHSSHTAQLFHHRTKSQLFAAKLDNTQPLSDRELTAKMMTHPTVLEIITAKQYRLGVSKLFLQADALIVLQSIKNRMILPQVLKLQKWWMRKSQNVLAHKLKRATTMLADLQLKAEVAGVHGLHPVRNALSECSAAVRYARGLSSLATDVFRPAVNTALEKVAILKDVVKRAVDAKEKEARQRAELLELLDSGRARLGYVQNGLKQITLDTAEVRRLVETAGQGLGEQSNDLLRAANREVMSMGTVHMDSLSSAELQRAYHEAMAEAKNGVEAEVDHEEALRQRRRKVDEVIGWVKQAEAAFQQVLEQQQAIDQARNAAKATLATAKTSLKRGVEVADMSNISHLLLVVQGITGARELVKTAEAALETNDALSFEHEVQKAAYAITELANLVDNEKRRKEDDDQRAEGRGYLDETTKKLEEIVREAELAGVRQAEVVVSAINAVEKELSAVALLVTGDPKAYVLACKATAAWLEGPRSALRTEKARKDRNDQQREGELSRLVSPLTTLQEIQSSINLSFELASEEALCSAVAAAIQFIEQLKVMIEKSDAVATLRDNVDAAVVQTSNAERLYSEVKQRLENRAREIATAKAQFEALEKRLAGLMLELTQDGKGDGILSQLIEEALTEARDAMADLERTLRRWNGSEVLRSAVNLAVDRVENLSTTINAQAQRIATAEKARQDELARLELAEGRLRDFVATEVESPALADKAVVRDTLTATEIALRSAGDRLRRTISVAWLQQDEIRQERAAVNEAIAKVEQAEGLILEERKRYDAWSRDAKANQANLEYGAEKLRELTELVKESKLGRIPTVQSALEDCECASDFATKLVGQSTADEGTEQAKRAVGTLLDKLKRSEAIIVTCKSKKEADEKERAEVQDRLDVVLSRLQGVVAMIEAAGPTVKQMTDSLLSETTTAVNNAARLLRRGDNIRELAVAVNGASQKVDAVETEAQAVKNRVSQASKLKAAANKKLSSLAETLALCVEKAECNGIQRIKPVEIALNSAEEALAGARRKAEGDLELWMKAAAVLARQIDEAALKIESAEEVVDDESQRKERAERDLEDLQLTADILAERHAMALALARDSGIAHVDPVQKASEAAELELASVRQALQSGSATSKSPVSFLAELTRLVAFEEEVLATQTRKFETRAADIQKAASDLPLLVERMKRVETVIETSLLGVGGVTPATEEALEDAQKAIWKVQRFISEGLSSLSLPVPRTDAALALIRKAEDLVQKQVCALTCLTQKRTDAITRLKFLEHKFADLEDEVAEFCSKSDHLRVQLEADWGDSCWWGSQTSHTQTGGAPMGRGEMKPITSVQLICENVAAAEAAMAAVKKRAEADIGTWVEGGNSATIFRALDDAQIKLDRAIEVLENEKLRVHKEDQERTIAARVLDQHSDRLAKFRVMAEARGVEHVSSVSESLQAAENALEIVAKLLEAGNAAVSSSAMDVASKKIFEVEEAIMVEFQRKDRYELQRTAAREELGRLKIRTEAMQELVRQLELEEVNGVVDSLRAVDKAADRAGVALSSGLAIATINKEVRFVLQRLEHAEREIRRERIRREELSKVKLRQEEEGRIRAAREAEEERRRAELERLRRAQLENELEKLMFRLSIHRPTLDKLQTNMEKAEQAIKSARSKLDEGGLIAAEAAAQSALSLTSSFEQTATSLWGPLGVTSPFDGNGNKTIHSTTTSSSGTTTGNEWVEADIMHSDVSTPLRSSIMMDTSFGVAISSSPAPPLSNGQFQAYMDRTSQALEVVARSVHTLSTGVGQLQSSVAQQLHNLDAQVEALEGLAPGKPARSSSSRLIAVDTSTPTLGKSPQRPSVRGDVNDKKTSVVASESSNGEEALGVAASGLNIPESGFKALLASGAEGEEEEQQQHQQGEDGDAEEDTDSSISSTPTSPSRNAALSKLNLLSEVGSSGSPSASPSAGDIFQLLSKWYSANVFDRLKNLVTKNGVTLQDCIAGGSFESDNLELFAGDYESYQLFSSLFEPVIQACHPLFKPDEAQEQPTNLNPECLVDAIDPDPSGRYVRKARLIVSRNLVGYNYTPKMSVRQLREVEKAVCAALETLPGHLKGHYTSMKDLMKNKALQEELDRAELPQTYRLTESAGMLSAWPEGRGIFLNQDRSLCVFINVEDHITVVCTAGKSNERPGGADMSRAAFTIASQALTLLSQQVQFEFDKKLGFITPSPAKLGTAFSFSLVFSMPQTGVDLQEVEKRYQVCLDRGKSARGGHNGTYVVYSKLSLGVSEIESVEQVLQASHYLLSG